MIYYNGRHWKESRVKRERERERERENKIYPVQYRDFGPILEQLLKIHKKSKINRNPLKVLTQHKYMYMYHKIIKNGEFSPFHFWRNLAKVPVLL